MRALLAELPRAVIAHIARALKGGKECSQERMLDGSRLGFLHQAVLCRIGGLVRAVNKNVVPGLVLFRLGVVGLVPGLTATEGDVEGNDQAPVAVAAVTDEISRGELCFSFAVLTAGSIEHDHGFYSALPKTL